MSLAPAEAVGNVEIKGSIKQRLGPAYLSSLASRVTGCHCLRSLDWSQVTGRAAHSSVGT